jgi:Flp pilus assembly protein TadG
MGHAGSRPGSVAWAMIGRNMINRMQKPRQRRAATSVEFAIVSGAFFLFLFGLIEVSRGLMVTHLLTNAAREGCRVGVVEGKSTSDITTTVVNRLNQQGVSSEGVTVQVNDNTADASTAKMGDEITVKVTVPVASVTWVPGGGFLTGNLGGQYTLRRE